MGMYASLSKGDLIEMNNKKLSRLLEPNLKLYFLCMIVFAAATATVSLPLGLVEIACTVGLYAYFTNRNQKRRQNILQYIDNVTGSVDTASKSTLINSPLPIMVFRPDTGEVIWSNENFLQLAGVREHLFEMKVEDAVPDFPVQWMLEGKQECPDRVVMNSRRFRVYGSLVRAKGRGAEQNLVATTYWVDTTEADDLRERYTATRPVLAILMVDNYEDLMKACADTQRSAVLAQIDEKLNNWAACADGLLLKTERDHYLFIFEECHYDHFVEEKFSILDAIREIKVGDVCPTLSIGIGKDADAMAELYQQRPSQPGDGPQPGRRPGGGPGKGGLPVLRRPQQVHGKAHQGEVPGHGQRPERADGRRVRDLYHGPQLCGHGCRRRRGGALLHCPQARQAGPDGH